METAETAKGRSMNKRSAVLAIGGLVLGVGLARAADSIRTTTQRVPSPGTIQRVSPVVVELQVGRTTKEFPVNEIVSISYDREPSALTTARMAVLSGRYEDALASLTKVELDQNARREIRQDVEFYRALCMAELALGGKGEIAAAGKEMASFVKEHGNSYHWLKANELVGDLYLALGYYQQAQKHYTELSKAPWPDYQMRAGVLVGRAQLAQGQTADALKSFEGVLTAQGATGELADVQRLAATVGQARCLAANRQYDQAIKAAEQVIAKVDPEEVELNARAYNALGTALKGAGRTKEALMAFLHVDVLYFAVPEAHAEALANLAELWDKLRKPQRAERARQTLQQRYKNSPWAK